MAGPDEYGMEEGDFRGPWFEVPPAEGEPWSIEGEIAGVGLGSLNMESPIASVEMIDFGGDGYPEEGGSGCEDGECGVPWAIE